MKVKRLVGLLLALCFIFGENLHPVFAAGEKAQEIQENQEGADSAEKDGTGEDSIPKGAVQEGIILEEATQEGADTLEEEVTNIEDTVLEAISYTLSATISQEKERLPSYTEDELMYLSCIIYCEAGGQSTTGKIAVANVVMNRAKSDVFDHVTTIKEVIYDCARWGRQFSPVYVRANGKWTTKGSAYEKALTMYKTGSYAKEWQKEQMEECIKAARSALEGKKVIGDFLYFNMGISSTKAKCQKAGADYKVIGCHIFY